MNYFTKRNIKTIKKSITKKNFKKEFKKDLKNKYSAKLLLKNSFLYASKKINGKDLLDYTKNNQVLNKSPCIMNNMSWFGSYKVAKSYQTHETHLYQWKIKQKTLLLTTNPQNKHFFKSLFLNNTKVKLVPAIELSREDIKKLNKNSDFSNSNLYPYVNMSLNERAYYEFCFVFGYISIQEQYEFMKFLKYLLEKKIITMKTRSGQSILKKLFIKINYYRLSHLFHSKKNNNRLSFYDLDKHAVLNVCKLVKANRIPISGIYQGNNDSFWFPNLVIYKMNIEETILFQPHENLIYDKMVE
jgi:hypothetical protein